MKHISTSEFQKEVLDHKGVVLVDFYADWCQPCKILGPILEDVDSANKEKDIKLLKLNVDENQQTAMQYGVMSIPTVIIFKDGKIVEQKVGVQSNETYMNALKSAKNFDPSKNKSEVTVFTTPTCPYCTQAKNYLKEKKVNFKEVDVSKDQAKAVEMVQKSGQMGVPQLWIGEQVVVGFNRPQIDTFLGL